jgi:hypothetical protein
LWEALHRSGIESATKKTAIEIGASDQPLCDGCFYIDKDVEVAKGRINIQADAWHLPFEEQSLRLIVMVNFPFYDDPSPIQIKALFQQLHLLLEKGGQVIVAQRNTHPVIAHADMHYFFAEKIGFNVQTFGGPYLKYGNESMMGLLLSK